MEDVRALFEPSGIYLDTATMGLPPRTAVEALSADLTAWQRGDVRAAGYDAVIVRARRAFARLNGVDPSWVAIGSQVSPLVGIVSASLPDRAEVLCCDRDFTSVLFPFLAHADRGVRVRTVPLEAMADSITPSTDWVALSAVQSSDGSVADLDAVAEAATAHGARVLVDATQSCGWLPLDAGRFDVVVCSAYKWLLSPRGTAFMTVRPDLWGRIVPLSAGWYAGDDVWSSIYGPPLRLAPDARRFDTSPARWNWVGTAIAVELLADLGAEAIGAHNRRLAARAAAALGEPDPGSAVLSLDREVDPERLAGHRVIASVRAGSLRLSFHLYNDDADVDAVVEALT